MAKKMPERTCVITREKTLKKDLIRVVRDKEGNVSVDTTGKANGRGAYIKKTIDTLEKAINFTEEIVANSKTNVDVINLYNEKYNSKNEKKLVR